MSALYLHDTERGNTLCARVGSIDYMYQAEQWVMDTARDRQNPEKPWLVRWELMGDDGVILRIWTRPDGSNDLPTLTYQHPRAQGDWKCEPHRVYVAGTRHTPDTLTVVETLRGAQVPVTSRWHDQPPGDIAGTQEARETCAMANYADLDNANVVVVVPCPTHHLRGAHTEVGYALGKGKPVVVVGKSGDLNTMTEHPNVTYTTLTNLVLNVARRSPAR